MRSNILIVLGLLSAVLISNSFLNEFFGESPGRQTKEATLGEIHLGATLPLTGDYASYGEEISKGMRLAVEDLARSEIKVKLHFEDVPIPDVRAVTAIRKLIEQDGIDALAGNFFNGNISAMAPVLKAKKKIAMHTAAADPSVLESGATVYCTTSRVRDEAEQMARLAFKSSGNKTAAVTYVGTIWGEWYAKFFSDEFQKLGGKIVYMEMSQIGERDYRAIFLKIRELNPGFIFAPHFGLNLGLVLKQAREVGVATPIGSTYESEIQSVIDVAGESANGLLYLTPRLVSSQPELGALAANAYDNVMLLARALTSCKKESSCLETTLRGVSEYEGLSGKISIDQDRGVSRTFEVKTIQSGAFRALSQS